MLRETAAVLVRGVGVAVAAGMRLACCFEHRSLNCKLKRPVRARARAININAAAAPIVIFASMLAVPRGPKAVLERVLENNAPASAFPG